MTKEIEPIKEKLDEKIKKLNSSRVFKKVTPMHDLSWYVKWVSVVFVIIGWMLTSVNFFPVVYYGTASTGCVGEKKCPQDSVLTIFSAKHDGSCEETQGV